MDCREFRMDLCTFMDGELDVWRRVRIRMHLSECPYCQGGYDFEVTLREHIRHSCEAPPTPEGLRDRIRECIAAECDDEASS